MKKEYNALDLFGGGDAVLKRFWGLTKKSIMNSTVGHLLILEESLNIPPEELAKSAISGTIEAKALLRVGPYVGVSIFEALGTPQYESQESRDYWTEEIHRSPISHPIQKNPDTERNFYVSLRAIFALHDYKETVRLAA